MKIEPLFALLAVGMVVAWLTPNGSSSDASSPDKAEAKGKPEQIAVAKEDPDPVVLPREADGHFYADVIVGSTASNMLVDTGATVIALTDEDANSMGVTWDQSQVRPVARGASGAVYGVPVMLDAVRVGDLEVRGVEAIIVPDDLDISLLGQSFLSRVSPVQIETGRMILGG
ncbi:MAG: TIGR02281 family clan AA aspartic protease [Porphyrobacter sp.]|nr:TIGR02281 family clan AA aspartic protease [Porphyrobacter sp.]